MSREERRAYERMMKNQDRGPALPPAARARAERNAARRAARRRPPEAAGALSLRFWLRSVLVAVVVGFLAFSLQWPQLPFAIYLGAAVAVVVLALLVGFRLLQRRAAALGSVDRPPR